MSPVDLELADGVLLIRMQDARTRNAMTAEMIDGLDRAFQRATEREVRAVVLTGTESAFSAGGDVKAQGDGLRSADAAYARLRRSHARIAIPLLTLRKPVVAAVNGVAAGAGLGLCLASDLRVIGDSARLVLAFARIGLVPDSASAFLLPRLVGVAKAKELLLLRREISPAEALALGLATTVTAPEDTVAEALRIARELAHGPTVALGLTKALLDDAMGSSLPAFLEREAAYQAIASQTQDHRGAREAFLAKRAPDFTGE